MPNAAPHPVAHVLMVRSGVRQEGRAFHICSVRPEREAPTSDAFARNRHDALARRRVPDQERAGIVAAQAQVCSHTHEVFETGLGLDEGADLIVAPIERAPAFESGIQIDAVLDHEVRQIHVCATEGPVDAIMHIHQACLLSREHQIGSGRHFEPAIIEVRGRAKGQDRRIAAIACSRRREVVGGDDLSTETEFNQIERRVRQCPVPTIASPEAAYLIGAGAPAIIAIADRHTEPIVVKDLHDTKTRQVFVLRLNGAAAPKGCN
mmetsp:Transcript_3464/g.6153  ORF Transcript_3464/g.6153 Transcript_3464/m.6153 type:complete len:264 (+) Transcript_3464:530-1321(+)